ncbi:MAG: hypothetical protein WD970_01850 [Patescibacteria group bacterium]
MIRILLALLLGGFSQISLLLPVETAQAATATYYFSPSTVDVGINQTRTVTLYLSSPSQKINSGSGTIVLPTSLVTGTSVNKSGSIFTNWPEEPGVSGSSIRFAGGLPHPGYSGGSGKILSFTVKGWSEGTGLITLNSGQILANDGQGTDINSGSPSATVDVTRVVSGAAIASETHPNQNKWYSVSTAKLSWSKPSGTSSYSYTLSKPGADSISVSSTNDTSATFKDLADGIWTFKLTTKYSDGKSASSSFTLQIDTVAPSQPKVSIDTQNDKDQFPTVEMLSTDEGSGVDHYEITIDSHEAINSETKSYKLPKQLPGNHAYSIIAVDKAGNKSIATAGKFFINGVPGPVITSSPAFVAILQPIILRGTALYGSVVQLYVDDKQVAEFYVSEYLSPSQERKSDGYAANEEVEWEYSLKQNFASGPKIIFATQTTSEGNDSFKSNSVNVRVLSGWISVGGIIIPIPVLFWLTSLLLILATGLIIFLWRKRSATLQERLVTLKKEVDEEVEELKDSQSNPETKVSVEATKAEIDKDFDKAAR